MVALSVITDNWLATHDVPVRIKLLVQDLIAFKKGIANMVSMDDEKKTVPL